MMCHIFSTKNAFMSIKIKKRISSDKSKVWYSLDWGRQANQRISTGVFTYQFPKN